MAEDNTADAKSEEISMMSVDQIKLHPKNAEVYGEDGTVADLIDSFAFCGIQEPLVVTSEGQIVSGHRRYRAAKDSGMTEVPVRVINSTDETDILIRLLEHNRHRIKSKEQIVREGKLLMELQKAQKKARQAALAKGEKLENFPRIGKGTTRDRAAKDLGISGKSLETGIKAVAAMDKLRAEGNEEKANAIKEALEKGFDGGLKKSKALVKSKCPTQDETTSREEDTTPAESKAELADAVESSDVKVKMLPKPPVRDSDAAIEIADRLVTFLRSASAKVLTGAPRSSLGKVLMQIEKLGKELGLISPAKGREA